MEEDDFFSVCEVCDEEYNNERIVGCCCKSGCEINNMCSKCGIWDEDEEEWYCPQCGN